MTRVGFLDELGVENVFESLDEALVRARDLMRPAAIP
jgi:hypothetical protein